MPAWFILYAGSFIVMLMLLLDVCDMCAEAGRKCRHGSLCMQAVSWLCLWCLNVFLLVVLCSIIIYLDAGAGKQGAPAVRYHNRPPGGV